MSSKRKALAKKAMLAVSNKSDKKDKREFLHNKRKKEGRAANYNTAEERSFSAALEEFGLRVHTMDG